MITEDEQKRIFSKNLRRLLEEHDRTQQDVADAIGVASQNVNNWCNGKSLPRMNRVQKLADYFDVRITDLTDEKPVKRKISVPVLGKIPAGIPFEAIQDIEDYEEMDYRPGEFFGLKVKGDSMYPTIQDGDTVILKKQGTCDNGQICAVMVNGDDATLKQVKFLSNGFIALQPMNPSYQPMIFSTADVASLPVRIIGVAVELRRKMML